jgi:hypothetical protein
LKFSAACLRESPEESSSFHISYEEEEEEEEVALSLLSISSLFFVNTLESPFMEMKLYLE